ncbi:MAG: hypothetical protein ABH872_05535 [Candidatus Omnitrophota bacterium]
MAKGINIIEYFSFLKKDNKIGSSYLFLGDSTKTINEIVKLILCPEPLSFCSECRDCRKAEAKTHPDVMVIEEEGSVVKLDDVHNAQKFMQMKSFLGGRKVLVIKGCQFTPVAESAFLKTLEEPPAGSFIALCRPKLEGLLPTTISRCKKIYLPASEEISGFNFPDLAGEFFAGSNIKFKNRVELADFLRNFIIIARRYLLSNSKLTDNSLPGSKVYGINLRRMGAYEMSSFLDTLFALYNASDTVNQNLALNIIRAKL